MLFSPLLVTYLTLKLQKSAYTGYSSYVLVTAIQYV